MRPEYRKGLDSKQEAAFSSSSLAVSLWLPLLAESNRDPAAKRRVEEECGDAGNHSSISDRVVHLRKTLKTTILTTLHINYNRDLNTENCGEEQKHPWRSVFALCT